MVDEPAVPPPPLPSLSPTPPPAPPPRSGAPRIVGILSIVFASLAMISGFSQSCGGMFLGDTMSSFWEGMDGRGAPDGVDSEKIRQAYATYAESSWAQVVTGLIILGMSAVLLAIGIGQVRFRRWARGASVGWGVTALAALVVIVVLQATVTGPATRALFESLMEAMPGGDGPPRGFIGAMGTMAAAGGVIGTIVFYTPYPIVLLIVFTRPRVRAAMDR